MQHAGVEETLRAARGTEKSAVVSEARDYIGEQEALIRRQDIACKVIRVRKEKVLTSQLYIYIYTFFFFCSILRNTI